SQVAAPPPETAPHEIERERPCGATTGPSPENPLSPQTSPTRHAHVPISPSWGDAPTSLGRDEGGISLASRSSALAGAQVPARRRSGRAWSFGGTRLALQKAGDGCEDDHHQPGGKYSGMLRSKVPLANWPREVADESLRAEAQRPPTAKAGRHGTGPRPARHRRALPPRHRRHAQCADGAPD